MRRRMLMLALGAVLTLALAACGAMPTSGDVHAGEVAQDSEPREVALLPNGPREGATPEQIVSDFIQAAKSPVGGWRIAQQFLADDADPWNPNDVVMVDNALRTIEVDDGGTSAFTTVSVTSEYSGAVDAAGVYTEFPLEKLELSYTLAKRNGEWRITHAPPGIVIERGVFTSTVYGAYTLWFFDPTWTYLVPDQRWFPRTLAASRTVRGLVAGPNAQLAPAVVSAFPPGTTIPEGSTISDGETVSVALADLGEGTDATTISRMRLQLQTSLTARSLELTIDGSIATGPAATAVGTSVDTRPIVLTKEGFGYLAGSTLTPIDGYLAAISQVEPVAIDLALSKQTAVVFDSHGRVLRIVKGDADLAVVDERPGLIPPSIDPLGNIWSMQAADAASLRVTALNGQPFRLELQFAGVSDVRGMQVSRDGTRLALAASFEGKSQLGYAAIVRDSSGVPTGIGPFVPIKQLAGDAIDVAWLDDLTIGALVKNSDGVTFVNQTIGGTGENVLTVPEDVVALTGTNSAATARLLSEDGHLYTRRDSQWSTTSEGIDIVVGQTATG